MLKENEPLVPGVGRRAAVYGLPPALWDLEIDLALYSPGFLPAVLMEAFGWFPQYLPAVVLCVCIALDGARSMPLRAAGGLLAVAGSGILLYMGAHHLVKRG